MGFGKMGLIGAKAGKSLEIMAIILFIDSILGSFMGNQQFNCLESLDCPTLITSSLAVQLLGCLTTQRTGGYTRLS